jgi:hypothetical protein
VDFALSPDRPALWCYFIILAIGFVAATVQINRLFPGFPQAWLMMSNWVLFAAFLLLPVLLFWFLDRTNTLHDTSLFGAILVALAYRQIFAGNMEKVNAPSQVSKIWDRVLKWADTRVAETMKRAGRNAESFDEKVIEYLTHNPAAFERVLELLKFHASDYFKIDADLFGVTFGRSSPTAGRNPARGILRRRYVSPGLDPHRSCKYCLCVSPRSAPACLDADPSLC